MAKDLGILDCQGKYIDIRRSPGLICLLKYSPYSLGWLQVMRQILILTFGGELEVVNQRKMHSYNIFLET